MPGAAAVLAIAVSACAADPGAMDRPRQPPGGYDEAASCERESAAPGEDILEYKGHRLKVVRGDVFRCARGRWQTEGSLAADWFKDFGIEKRDAGCVLVHRPTGQSAPLATRFRSGFEVDDFFDLFDKTGWTTMTLLSPRADSVDKYTALARRLLRSRRAQFLDNRVDLVSDNVHRGDRAARFHAVAPGPRMVTSKALIEKKRLCFGRGDEVWIAGWFYVESGMPATLFDLETPMLRESPGIRLIVGEGRFAGVELKWLEKIRYRQSEVAIPHRRWFELKLHLRLSNRDDGLVELWQDGALLMSTHGQTLPTHDTVYWSLQYGITATPRETILLADDVIISDRPL